MMHGLRGSKPLYPLLCIISGILVFFTGLLFVKQPWFVFFILAIAILYSFFGYFQVMIKAVIIFSVIGLLTFGITVFFYPAQNALQNLYRMLLLGLSGVPTVSLPPINLVRNLNAIKVPRWLTLGLLICIRFFGIMSVEIKRIKCAMKLRGISGWYNPRVWYRAIIIPFMMRLFSISDMLSLSLETRAFSMTSKTSIYKEVSLTLRDVLYFIIIVTIIILGFILKYKGWWHA